MSQGYIATRERNTVMARLLPKELERKQYGLRLTVRLMRELQHLAVDEGKRMNDLTEEAIRDLLKKYREKRKG